MKFRKVWTVGFLAASQNVLLMLQRRKICRPGGPWWWAACPGCTWRRTLLGGEAVAAQIRVHVHATLGLAVTWAVTRNKLLAMLASPRVKPDGLAVVPDQAANSFLAATSLRKITGLDG